MSTIELSCLKKIGANVLKVLFQCKNLTFSVCGHLTVIWLEHPMVKQKLTSGPCLLTLCVRDMVSKAAI